MRAFGPELVVALAQFLALGLAAPLDSSIAIRSQFCQNAPNTIAGTTFDRRTDSSTPIGPRSPAVTALWCAPGGQTWIILELTAPVAANIVMPMILQARAAILLRITQVGDAVFPGGLFSWLGGNGHVLRTQNSNNHQMTYGVVAAALTAVIDYMQTENAFGVGSFTIYDGANEVAKGTIT